MPDTVRMRMPLAAGELREVLEFYKPQDAIGDYGQKAQPPALMFQARGLVEPLSGRELDEARRLAPLATLRVTIGGGDLQIEENWHIIHVNRSNTKYNIGHILDVETRGRRIVLLCHREACP